MKTTQFEDALLLNNSINANLIPEQALKGANAIMLTHILYPDSVYTTDEIDQLNLIAHTCVHTGGNGVLMARNILDQLIPDTITLYGDRYTDSLYCAYNNNFRIRNNQLKQDKTSSIVNLTSETKWTVLPNPAKNTVNIVLSKNCIDKIKVEILPVNGSEVMLVDYIEQGNNKLRLNVSGLPNGIYICKLSCSGKKVEYKKLTVINY